MLWMGFVGSEQLWECARETPPGSWRNSMPDEQSMMPLGFPRQTLETPTPKQLGGISALVVWP